jgi:eukaryotic-like serine/threonine-protein kinase
LTERVQGRFASAILRDEPVAPSELNPQVSSALEAVIDKALEKDRNLRYQHASEMHADLQRVKRDSESGRYPTLSQKKGQDGAPSSPVIDEKKPTPPTDGEVGYAETSWIGTKTPTQAARRRPLESGTRSWVFLAAAALLIVVLVGGAVYYRSHQEKPLTDKDTIVVADFDNKTGDAVFDDTLKTALTVALNQSPFLNVLPDNKIAATLKLMTKPVGTRLTPEVARELCQRAGSKAYIAGSIAALGSEYVIGLTAVNCRTDDLLVELLDGRVGAAGRGAGERAASHDPNRRRRGPDPHPRPRLLQRLPHPLEGCGSRHSDP